MTEEATAPQWLPFRHGALRGAVVNDGLLRLGPAQRQFPAQPPEAVAEVVRSVGGDTDSFDLDQNVLVLRIGPSLVVFDVGVGSAPAWGRRRFGPGTGHLVEGLHAAGVDPAEVDVVALTHAHPDHCWGLVDADGERVFPNARLAVGRHDVEHFVSAAEAGDFANDAAADRYLGAARSLRPYLDGAALLEDGAEVVPGLGAEATPGHTPGHLLFRIADPAGDLVFWGDLCHHEALLRRPEWGTGFDHDPVAASRERIAVLARVAGPGTAVLSYHFPFPGYGTVRSTGVAGPPSYRWAGRNRT